MAKILDSPEQYSVGWIAALSIERGAATALLDERHETPSNFEQHQHDGNSYTWGRMGKHNIVIASLPAGVYGTNAAATTVAHLLSSLPHIKIGLLVGIGGGVPQDGEDADIRLGDVVVSQPGGTSGGVIQYDLVKAKVGNTWERKGTLDKPPKILLSSLSKIQAEHEISPSKIPEILEEMWKSNPRMKTGKKKAPAYVHQGFENDRLFQPDYDHVGGSTCAHCIGAEEIQRESRESTDPEIHYGLIASGNTLVKDARERDWILDKVAPGCICFEMEAAGLMDSFPCLVIRGICDYADSHKNDAWQRYAAATAAAFAKELLEFVPVPDLRTSPRAVDLISSMGQRIEQKIHSLSSSIINTEHKRMLDALPVAEDAPFDSEAEANRPTCLVGTRVELLEEIMGWAGSSPIRSQVFWLRGIAGTGKSTISRSVAQRLQRRGRLAASFFFKRGEGDCGNPSKLVTTLAKQLACRNRAVAMSLQATIEQDTKISSRPLEEQFDKLVVHPLSQSELKADKRQPLVIVIDALDECDFGDEAVKKVKRVLGLFNRAKELKVKIFATSRPDLPIKLGFAWLRKVFEELTIHELSLHEMAAAEVRRDLTLFMRQELSTIRNNHNINLDDGDSRLLPLEWPGESIGILVEMANPLFISAATICRLIGEQRVAGPQTQLSKVLEYGGGGRSNLDATYSPVLSQLVTGLSRTQQREVVARFAKVVAPIVILAEPLSPSSLSRLLCFPLDDIQGLLDFLHSVLSIHADPNLPVRLYHQSFRDFLLDPDKRGNPDDYPFWVDEQRTHETLAEKCLGLLLTPGSLRENMCRLEALGTRRVEIESGRITACLPPEVQYACQFWTFHCKMSGSFISDGGRVEEFLTKHLLHWTEVLATLGRASEITGMVRDLLETLDKDCSQRLRPLLADFRRLMMQNWAILDEAPLQVYASTLVFAPIQSIVRNVYRSDIIPLCPLPTAEEEWDACWATLEHGNAVRSVALSPNVTLLASGSRDGIIRLYEPETGVCTETLEGHSSSITSVAFSPDRTRDILASAAVDGSVIVWDLAANERVKTIHGPTGSAWAVRFSPDFAKVAICYNQTVKIFEARGYTWIGSLGDQVGSITAAEFSPDSSQLAYISRDQTLRLWDLATNACLATLQLGGRTGIGPCVTFSHDSKTLVSASTNTIHLWNPRTKIRAANLRGHTGDVNSVVFSPDSSRLASGSRDRTVRIWDTTSMTCVATLRGHGDIVWSVIFLSDQSRLASASQDGTVRLWDTSLGKCSCGTTEGAQHHAPDDSLDLEASDNAQEILSYDSRTAVLWDSRNGASIWKRTMQNSAEIVNVRLSPDGQKVAVCLNDGDIQIWDTKTAVRIATLEQGCRPPPIPTVVFSHDSKILATCSERGPLRLWDLVDGACNLIDLGGENWPDSPQIVFSRDFSRVATMRQTVKVWDMATLSCIGHLDEGASWRPTSVALSQDSTMLAAGSSRGDITLWSTSAGEKTAILDGGGWIKELTFYQEASRVASASMRGNVMLWDVAEAACIAVLKCPTDHLAFSARNDILFTDVGCYALEASPPDPRRVTQRRAQPQTWRQSVGISDDGNWIKWRSKDTLWLPPAYRPFSSSRCTGSTIAITNTSGRVIFIGIREMDISVGGLWRLP